MKRIIISLFLLPGITHAQVGDTTGSDSLKKGIRFERGQSWKQIVERAKTNNKFIFVDCYATWCGPCKQMDLAVYPLATVGEIFNSKFISVKAQMDTSQKDNEDIRKWYTDAEYLHVKYDVSAYPTLLFFTPDGQMVGKSVGQLSSNDLISKASNVLNTEKDFSKALRKFNEGKREGKEMRYLARTSLLLGDTVTSKKIAGEYIRALKGDELLIKDNIQFIADFTKSSEEVGFKFLYKNSSRVNRIMKNDIYCQRFVQSIIYKEIVQPEFERAEKAGTRAPNWSSMTTKIKGKYGEYYSGMLVTGFKSTWAAGRKNEPEYVKYLLLYERKYGTKSNADIWTAGELNNVAWATFQYSDSREELIEALEFSRRAVMMAPSANFMDTYANLLYKLNRKSEAIVWEEIASKLDHNDRDIVANLERMKRELRTGGN